MANCIYCGQPLLPGTMFCTNCGKPTATQDAAQADATPASEPEAITMESTAQSNYQVPPVAAPAYSTPYSPVPASLDNGEVIGFGDWMLTLFLTTIPIVNIIMLFIWSFGGSTPASKSNWAKARLVWLAIGIVLSILSFVTFGLSMIALISEFS